MVFPILIGNLCAEGAGAPATAPSGDSHHELIVSLRDQKLLLLEDGKPDGIFSVSTSRFGVGDRWGSFATPLGKLLVRMKIGMGKPLGTVFHSRVPTGEVLKPNSPFVVRDCTRNPQNRLAIVLLFCLVWVSFSVSVIISNSCRSIQFGNFIFQFTFLFQILRF